jgi:hypothetical protein
MEAMKEGPEGWEWVRIQQLPCPQCGQNPSAGPPGELGAVVEESLDGWRLFLAGARSQDDYLRTHPGPEVWSPIQYGFHVRDMLKVFGDRILLAVEQDDPAVPWFDPGPEGWAAYDRAGVEELVAELEKQTARFAGIVEGCGAGDWGRTARRDGVDRFTVAGLACFGAHEAHHHLLDAEGSI